MTSTELAAVQALEDERISAMCSQDAETLDRLLSDELYYMHSSGSVDTKASFLDAVRNGPLRYKTVERRDVEARLAGDATAIFTGEASIHVEFDGAGFDLELRFVAVWVRHADAWRFEVWQSASA